MHSILQREFQSLLKLFLEGYGLVPAPVLALAQWCPFLWFLASLQSTTWACKALRDPWARAVLQGPMGITNPVVFRQDCKPRGELAWVTWTSARSCLFLTSSKIIRTSSDIICRAKPPLKWEGIVGYPIQSDAWRLHHSICYYITFLPICRPCSLFKEL